MSMILTGERVGRAMHRVDDRALTARVLKWMLIEANNCNWWLAAVTHDGKVIEWDSKSSAGINERHDPPRDKKHYALRVLSALNRLAELGGAWMVAFFDDEKRFYLLWKDADGDLQIPIECDKSWLIYREWDMDHWCQMAVMAHTQWTEFHRNMDYGKGQRVKLALGEKPAGWR